jgi:hypothetical protein
MTLLQEAVICLDRWCAIVRPLQYWLKRKIKHGFVATFVVLFWFHIWYLPLNILNYYTPMSQRAGCDGTTYPNHRSVVSFFVMIIPSVLVYGSYPDATVLGDTLFMKVTEGIQRSKI